MYFILFCRKHDIRLGLNRFETVPEGDSTIQKLFKTLTMPNPETLECVPRTDEWVINFIRHKRRETFFLDEKYMVTVTEVKERSIKWMPHGTSIVIGPEDYDKPHMEVEVITLHIIPYTVLSFHFVQQYLATIDVAT